MVEKYIKLKVEWPLSCKDFKKGKILNEKGDDPLKLKVSFF